MDCHYILGIPKNADFNQIRKAYLEKAKKYHPDMNKSPDAHRKFIQIRKAYEYLMYAKSNSSFQSYVYNNDFCSNSSVNSYTNYWRYTSFRNDSAVHNFSGYYTDYAFSKGIINTFKCISFFTFLIALSIFMDYFLPYNHLLAQVVKLNGRDIYVEEISKNYSPENIKKLNVSSGFHIFNKIGKGDKIEVKSTPLYSFDRKVFVSGKKGTNIIYPEFSIYDYFIFFPLSLLSISFLAIIFLKSDLYSIKFGVANAMVLILMGVFFLMI